MPLGILFWVLMIVSLVFGVWNSQVPGQPFTLRSWGNNLLLFILLAILGWKVFGSAITG